MAKGKNVKSSWGLVENLKKRYNVKQLGICGESSDVQWNPGRKGSLSLFKEMYGIWMKLVLVYFTRSRVWLEE